MSEIEKLKSQLTRIKAERDLYRGVLNKIGAYFDCMQCEMSSSGRTCEDHLEDRMQWAKDAIEQGTKIANNEGESRG